MKPPWPTWEVTLTRIDGTLPDQCPGCGHALSTPLDLLSDEWDCHTHDLIQTRHGFECGAQGDSVNPATYTEDWRCAHCRAVLPLTKDQQCTQ